MKGDPLLSRQLPRTQILIRQEVEVWPNKPDPDAPRLRLMLPGAMIGVRTSDGRIRQRQLRMVRVASSWGRHNGRRYVVAHDKQSVCHIHWLDDVIRVVPRMRELMP